MCKNILFVIIFIITGFVINYISCCKTSNTERYIEGMTLSEWELATANVIAKTIDTVDGTTYNHVGDNEQFSVENRKTLLPIEDCANDPSKCFDTIDELIIPDTRHINLTTNNENEGNDPIMFLKTAMDMDSTIMAQVYSAFGYNFIRAINETNMRNNSGVAGGYTISYKNVYDQNKPLLLTSSVIHPGDNTSQAATKISTKLANIIFYIMRMHNLKNSQLFDKTSEKISFYRNRDFLNRIKLDKRWKDLKVISNGSLDPVDDGEWTGLENSTNIDILKNTEKMGVIAGYISHWQNAKHTLETELQALYTQDESDVANYEAKKVDLDERIDALNQQIADYQEQYMNNQISDANLELLDTNNTLNIATTLNTTLTNTRGNFDIDNTYNSSNNPVNNNEYTTRLNDLRQYYNFDDSNGQTWNDFMHNKLAVAESINYAEDVIDLNATNTQIGNIRTLNTQLSGVSSTINNKNLNVLGVNSNISNINDDIQIYS